MCRWRKLEGSDPSTFEMIQKIQTLQKRLITKTEEVVERDLLIQEKEKLYVELKNILSRQPGPEVAEQLSTYQANIREKNKQMKSMASELNTHQAQVPFSAPWHDAGTWKFRTCSCMTGKKFQMLLKGKPLTSYSSTACYSARTPPSIGWNC